MLYLKSVEGPNTMFGLFYSPAYLLAVYDMPSTVISSFHYDPDTKILNIIFVSGIMYAYKDVPKDVYDKFKAAFSKGIFFNQYIKPNYDVEKIDP